MAIPSTGKIAIAEALAILTEVIFDIAYVFPPRIALAVVTLIFSVSSNTSSDGCSAIVFLNSLELIVLKKLVQTTFLSWSED
jgi:hypothetical protein